MKILAQTAIFPEQASTTAAHVDSLFFFLVSVCGAVGLLVAFLLIYFCIRYRRRPGDVGDACRTRFIGSARMVLDDYADCHLRRDVLLGRRRLCRRLPAPDDAIRIYGIGKQWMWKFQHPEGQREINTLHLPLGRPVQILLTSEDVIHSFFVPEFRVHMDVLAQSVHVALVPSDEAGERTTCSARSTAERIMPA